MFDRKSGVIMTSAYRYGPFHDDEGTNVSAYPNPAPTEPVPHDRYREEITEYFTRRTERLKIARTTKTARGQTLDWIPIESQHPKGLIASPPPLESATEYAPSRQPEEVAIAELEFTEHERGPDGTVPILRKKLARLGYTAPLRQYLSKYRGRFVLSFGGLTSLQPGGGRGTHWMGAAHQKVLCFGGHGQFSCFNPYTASSDEFSLIQIALSNSDLPLRQTVETGWQKYPDITGDWVPHLFVYYTTNGYTWDDDYQGGYNRDVDGWVQYDNVIFPGTTFSPLSEIGGAQRQISLKYQLYRDNWWLKCQDRWIGYYPARLFMGNQSVFSTLGDHADRISFYGEVATFDSTPTNTDMGSGRFASEGWTRAAYFHHLRVQTDRVGGMTRYRGVRAATDKNLYDIDTHFEDNTDWESYAFVGGPGAG